MRWPILVAALAVGAAITFVDTRPTWDDTGITALATFAAAFAFGYLEPKRPWLWGLAIGLWIPLLGIVGQQNYATLLALVVALAGAYAGMGLKYATRKTA